jgi:UDP-glucose 4-epimerase
MTPPLSWVVGGGGLLGSSVARALSAEGPIWAPSSAILWDDHDRAVEQVSSFASTFLEAAGTSSWQVAWCAGAGVTATSATALEHEMQLFSTLLDALRAGSTAGGIQRGSLFLGSSAGALYAGSAAPPFTEATPVLPISAYGVAKLELERRATDWAVDSGQSAVLGRIANLYGPAQNLRKPQGLISQIIRSHLLRRPISIYVPLDTVRDYLFAPDCGLLVAGALKRLRTSDSEPAPQVVTKILASQQGVTVAAVLGEMRRVFKRRPQIILGSSPQAMLQARDLRLRSEVWRGLDRRALTPLGVGIHRTTAHLLDLVGQGAL